MKEKHRVARRNPRREARIASVRAAQRAAGKKVSRLRTRTGIQVEGIDPRRPWNEVQTMSAAELRSYEKLLAKFVSRSTGFVAGSRGAPLRKSTVEQYRELEKQFNEKVKVWNESVAKLPISNTGLTVGQRRAMLAESKFPRPGGNWKTMQEFHRSLRGVTSEEGLQKLIADLQQRLKPGFVSKEMRAQRKSLEKMLTDTGDADVWNQVKRLTNRQLQVLVDETDFMSSLGYRYSAQRADGGSGNDDVYDAAGLNVRDLADWAHTLPIR